MVSTVTSQQGGHVLVYQGLGPFCGDFAGSSCVCVGFPRVPGILPQSKNRHVCFNVVCVCFSFSVAVQ